MTDGRWSRVSNPHEDMIWPRMQLMSKAPHHQGNSLTKSFHSRGYLFGIKRCRQTKKIKPHLQKFVHDPSSVVTTTSFMSAKYPAGKRHNLSVTHRIYHQNMSSFASIR